MKIFINFILLHRKKNEFLGRKNLMRQEILFLCNLFRLVSSRHKFIVKNKKIKFLERKNSSPSRSPSEKTRRPWTSAVEKTRISGSGGSVDSRSGSASPDRGSRTTSFFQRSGSERSSGERLRITTNRDSIRSNKDSSTEHDKDSCGKDIIDGDVRPDEDNEPPAPAPSSRPTSPTSSLGEQALALVLKLSLIIYV